MFTGVISGMQLFLYFIAFLPLCMINMLTLDSFPSFMYSTRQIYSAKYDGTDKKTFISEGNQWVFSSIIFSMEIKTFDLILFQTLFRQKASLLIGSQDVFIGLIHQKTPLKLLLWMMPSHVLLLLKAI